MILQDSKTEANQYESSNIYQYEGLTFNIANEFIGHRYKIDELKSYLKDPTYFSQNYENYDTDNDGDAEYADVQVLENFFLGMSVLGTKDSRWYNHDELYYLHDSLGSVIGAERTGTVKPIRYNAFGVDVKEYNKDNSFGFSGKQFDETTKLYNFGYRDYSTTQARFTTVDPIKDGNNWYVYVNSDPVNYIDPLGLDVVDGNVSTNLSGKITDEEYMNAVGVNLPEINVPDANSDLVDVINDVINTVTDSITELHNNLKLDPNFNHPTNLKIPPTITDLSSGYEKSKSRLEKLSDIPNWGYMSEPEGAYNYLGPVNDTLLSLSPTPGPYAMSAVNVTYAVATKGRSLTMDSYQVQAHTQMVQSEAIMTAIQSPEFTVIVDNVIDTLKLSLTINSINGWTN